jgi:hypothetical protein
MVDFNSILNDARQLSEDDKWRLIDALANQESGDEDAIARAWDETLKRRIAEVHSGAVELIPWETIRDESLRRIGANNVD